MRFRSWHLFSVDSRKPEAIPWILRVTIRLWTALPKFRKSPPGIYEINNVGQCKNSLPLTTRNPLSDLFVQKRRFHGFDVFKRFDRISSISNTWLYPFDVKGRLIVRINESMTINWLSDIINSKKTSIDNGSTAFYNVSLEHVRDATRCHKLSKNEFTKDFQQTFSVHVGSTT